MKKRKEMQNYELCFIKVLRKVIGIVRYLTTNINTNLLLTANVLRSSILFRF